MQNIFKKPIEVPLQPYAGKPLIIKNFIRPESIDDIKLENKMITSVAKFKKFMQRPSFFEPRVIEKTLVKYCSMEAMPKHFKDELVEALLAAAETYLELLIKSVIELCEHRAGNSLYSDARCVMQHNMRTTLMFLNEREVADYGYSEDDCAYGHRRRWMKLQRNRMTNAAESEMRLETTNSTALLALGTRKPISTGGTVTGFLTSRAVQPVQRSFVVRIKHVNVKDIMQYMENQKRYIKSKLLYDAYLTYKW